MAPSTPCCTCSGGLPALHGEHELQAVPRSIRWELSGEVLSHMGKDDGTLPKTSACKGVRELDSEPARCVRNATTSSRKPSKGRSRFLRQYLRSRKRTTCTNHSFMVAHCTRAAGMQGMPAKMSRGFCPLLHTSNTNPQRCLRCLKAQSTHPQSCGTPNTSTKTPNVRAAFQKAIGTWNMSENSQLGGDCHWR